MASKSLIWFLPGNGTAATSIKPFLGNMAKELVQRAHKLQQIIYTRTLISKTYNPNQGTEEGAF